MLLSRFLSNRRLLQTLISSKPYRFPNPPPNPNRCPIPVRNLPSPSPRFFSSSAGGGGDGAWKIAAENDPTADEIFDHDAGTLEGFAAEEGMKPDGGDGVKPWTLGKPEEDVFDIGEGLGVVEGKPEAVGKEGGAWGMRPWSLGGEERKGEEEDVFDIGEDLALGAGFGGVEEGAAEEAQRAVEETRLEKEEKELKAIIKGGTSSSVCNIYNFMRGWQC